MVEGPAKLRDTWIVLGQVPRPTEVCEINGMPKSAIDASDAQFGSLSSLKPHGGQAFISRVGALLEAPADQPLSLLSHA